MRLLVIWLSVVGVILWACLGSGEGTGGSVATGGEEPFQGSVGGTNVTTITSKTMTLDMKASEVIFETDVMVVDSEFTLEADRLTVVSEGTNQIKSLLAEGNVHLRAEEGEATCQRMAYGKAMGEVVLERDATLRQADRVMSADRIEFRLLGGEIDAVRGEGNVEVSYYSKDVLPVQGGVGAEGVSVPGD